MTETTQKDDIKPANPWADQDLRDVLESAGSRFHWNGGWWLDLRRVCGWNKHWTEATARLGRRADVKAFLARTSAKGYAYTDSDLAFWRKVELDQFAEGCVVNWNVTDRDGKPMTMTPANLRMVFEKFQDFYFSARAFANDGDNYTPEIPDAGEALGN